MLKNKLYLFSVIALISLLLAACAPAPAATTEPEETDEPTAEPTEEMEVTEEATEAAEPTEEATEAATEEGSELGTEDNPIVFSFVPSGEAEEVIASADAIAEALSEATGLTIEANVPTDYVSAIEAMCAGEAHMGALATFAYAIAAERECADVALASVRFGVPTYNGQIVASVESGITDIAGLEGATFCRPDPLSTSGWIIPSITLRANDIDPDADLAEVIDAGGHDGVIRSVYDGTCDAGATFVDARTSVEDELTDVMDKVVVIATSQDIPNDTISFSPDVPEDIRQQIVEAMLAMTDDEAQLQMLNDLYRWEDLVEVDDAFYDEFRQLLETAGVSVEDYVK